MNENVSKSTYPSPVELRRIIEEAFETYFTEALSPLVLTSELLRDASSKDELTHGLTGALLEAKVLSRKDYPPLSWFGLHKGKDSYFLVRRYKNGCIVFGQAMRINDDLWNACWNCVFFIIPQNKNWPRIVFQKKYGRPRLFTPGISEEESDQHIIDLEASMKKQLHRLALATIGVKVKDFRSQS